MNRIAAITVTTVASSLLLLGIAAAPASAGNSWTGGGDFAVTGR
jgi:hypothetical protein